jgi:hydrogenase maturation protease
MADKLVIGYGNPLRGDDAVGWHAAEYLMKTHCHPDVQIITCHQLTPELAERVSRSALVVFIDAEEREPVGAVSCRAVGPAATRTPFAHYLSPAALLALAAQLYGACPPAAVFSVSSTAFDCGERLSPAVVSALPELSERIRTLIANRRTFQPHDPITQS